MKKVNWYILIPILALFLVSGYYVVTTSSLVRFWADDFCSAVFLRNNGYLQSQIMWWNGWTGRYSYIAFLDLVQLFGLNGAKILPIIQYLLIFLIGFPYSLISIFYLTTSPNIIQTFYWMTGSLNYFAPFIFLNGFLLLLFKPIRKWTLFAGFMTLLISTGFSEAFGVANILLLSLLFLILKNTDQRKILIVGIVSTVLSLGVMYIAPGNAVRSATVNHPESIGALITSTLIYSKWYLIHLMYIKSFVLSVLVVISGAFVFLKAKTKYFTSPKLVLLYSSLFMIAVTLAVVGLTYQAMNWEPPERVMSIVNNMIILATVIFSIALFQIFQNSVSKTFSRLAFAVLVLLLTYSVSLDWGKVKNELKVSANSPTHMAVGKLDGLTENNGWVATCIAGYNKLD